MKHLLDMWHVFAFEDGNSGPSLRDSHPNISLLFSLLIFLVAYGLPSRVEGASQSDFHFGDETKRTSISILGGASLVSGDRSGLGANGFLTSLGADSLYDSPTHFVIEYGEHSRHTSLTFGLEYTRITPTESLHSALGLASGSPLTVGYLDAPITYQLNAFSAGDSPLNLFAGLSLIPMLDIASSTESIFESGASGATTGSTTGATGGLSDKHVDFGFGFGGEIGFERRLAGKVFLNGRIGFRHPFTGVTRPDMGFFLTGIRIYQ